MARRTVDITVRVSVDEDQMRAVEDNEPTAWAGLLATLVVALESIVDDNLFVHGTATATVGTPWIEHEYVATPPAVPGDGYCQDEPERDEVRRPAPGCVDDEQVDA